MSQKNFLLSVLFVYLVSTPIYAQKYPYKFGKVSLEELEMKECSFSPEAHSMVLAEKGVLKMSYWSNGGWKYTLSTTVRKKIFNSEDSDGGNIRLRIYTPEIGSRKEEIISFKAFSYNIENGEIKRQKINFRDVHKRRINNYFSEVNYIIPDIKNGTVIEYQYQKRSDYITNLDRWYFQRVDVPVAYSEFSYTIPEWFNYQINQLGNQIDGQWTSKSVNETFSIRYKKEDNDNAQLGRVGSGYVTSDLKSTSKFRKGVFKNILPIFKEPFTANISDVPARIEFQLISIDYPTQPMEVIAGDYQKFNDELLDHSSFGKRFNKKGFLDDAIKDLLPQKKSLEKALILYSHLQKHFNWTKTHDYFSSSSGREAYKKKEGTVADINFSLLAALREYGLEAQPVILSTRGHGTVHPIYPSYNEFNYVIVAIEIDGKMYLADASSALPFDELPLKCRNGKGWLVHEKNSRWIDLKRNSSYKKTSLIDFKIDENNISVNINQQLKKYASYTKIDELNESTESEIKEDLTSKYIDYELIKVEVNNKGYSTPLTLHYEFRQALEDHKVIYLQPLFMGAINENPFSRETRDAPIDIPYQQQFNVITTVEIPEGYAVEVPEQSLIKLPNEGGEFRFIIHHKGNKITLSSSLKINQTYFVNTEYASIKQFYDLVSSKNNELIVLTKL